ncbi:MAG: preprotein translocase subunit SecE [Planctomycetaceae bacterium]|nr:preprotein translocase subunit SecE [Planctomycetaceae bacterium]
MSGFFRELFRLNLYKRSQGHLVRRLTLFGIAALFIWGAIRFADPNIGFRVFEKLNEKWAFCAVYGTSAIITLFGLWFAFRLVNFPRFADFLIAVEAEMVKVSWPSRKELYTTTIVVICVMIILTVSLFCFDFVWLQLYQGLYSLATGW